MEHHSNIVPWQLLARADRRHPALVRRHRRRPARPGRRRGRRADQRADQDRLGGVRVQRAGHGQPDRRDRGAGARRRRHGGRGRLPGRAAAAGRRRPHWRRSGRLHRAQDGRPDRHRRALGPLRPAGRAAAVPRRRRDDRDRQDDRLDLRAAAAPVRGRHAADRPGGRAGCGRAATCAIGMDQIAAHEQEITGVRAEGPARPARAADPRPERARGPGRRDLVHADRRRTPIHPHDVSHCWTRGASRSAAGTTAPAVARALRSAVLDPGVVLPVHDPAEIDALVDGLDYVTNFFGRGAAARQEAASEGRGPVPGDHP